MKLEARVFGMTSQTIQYKKNYAICYCPPQMKEFNLAILRNITSTSMISYFGVVGV